MKGVTPGEGPVFSARLAAFLADLLDGQTPNAGRFCACCCTPLPAGFDRCDFCGGDAVGRNPLPSVPDAVVEMHRRKQRRESVIVNSFAYFGLALGLAVFLGLVAINVLLLGKALWFFLLATVVFLAGSRLLAALFGGVIGDEVGYRYANRKLAEEWAAYAAGREGDDGGGPSSEVAGHSTP